MTEATQPTVAQQWGAQPPSVKQLVIQYMLQRREADKAHEARNPFNDPGAYSSSDELALGDPARASPVTLGRATGKSMLQSAFASAVGSVVPTFLSGLLPGRERSFGDYLKNGLVAAFGGATNNLFTEGKSDWKSSLGIGAAAGGVMELLGGKDPGWGSLIAGVLMVPIMLGLGKMMNGMLDKVAARNNVQLAPAAPAPAYSQ